MYIAFSLILYYNSSIVPNTAFFRGSILGKADYYNKVSGVLPYKKGRAYKEKGKAYA